MRERVDHPTFLLGVGAMKAGTTWLHDHLASSPQAAPGFRKEWHVLDVVDLPSERWMRARIASRAARAAHAVTNGRAVSASLLHQVSMVLDPDNHYPAYVADLLAGGARVTFDITPSYALLPAARFAWVRESFEERGIRARAVFLMRDPVDRLWSHVRMLGARTRSTASGAPATEATLVDAYRRPSFESRTRYEQTLAALASGFEPSEVHLALYEQLFTPDSVEALNNFAGIDPHPARLDLRANASPPADVPLSEEVERRVAQHFAATYESVAAALPQVDLQAIWPSSRWVL